MLQYLVFECTKCHQFTYAKVSQKGKKCPRCGRNHKVSSLKGIIVEGPTKAMLEVKKRQNVMGMGISSGFERKNKSIAIQQLSIPFKNNDSIDENESDLNDILKKIYEFQKLNSISNDFGFPEYILEMILDDLNFPKFQNTRSINALKSYNKLQNLPNGNFYLK